MMDKTLRDAPLSVMQFSESQESCTNQLAAWLHIFMILSELPQSHRGRSVVAQSLLAASLLT